jgi:hypothetical protein
MLLLLNYLEEKMQDENDKVMNNFDFITSNLPGPVEELYYGGCKLTSIIGLPNIKKIMLFILITSYNKQFRITCAANECINLMGNCF